MPLVCVIYMQVDESELHAATSETGESTENETFGRYSDADEYDNEDERSGILQQQPASQTGMTTIAGRVELWNGRVHCC